LLWQEDTDERNGPAWVHKTGWFEAHAVRRREIVSLLKNSQDLPPSAEAEWQAPKNRAAIAGAKLVFIIFVCKSGKH